MGNSINETMDIKDPSLSVWQQSGQYLPDSGIHSGGSTQTHSITTKEDDIERDRLLFDLDQGFPQSFPQDQVNGTIDFNCRHCVCVQSHLMFSVFRHESEFRTNVW